MLLRLTSDVISFIYKLTTVKCGPNLHFEYGGLLEKSPESVGTLIQILDFNFVIYPIFNRVLELYIFSLVSCINFHILCKAQEILFLETVRYKF